MTASVILAILISGFVTGALARLAIPGPDPMPIWLTIAIGLAGSITGAVIGKAISHDNGFVISFLSFGVAMALVAGYRRFVQRRPIFGPGARHPSRLAGRNSQLLSECSSSSFCCSSSGNTSPTWSKCPSAEIFPCRMT